MQTRICLFPLVVPSWWLMLAWTGKPSTLPFHYKTELRSRATDNLRLMVLPLIAMQQLLLQCQRLFAHRSAEPIFQQKMSLQLFPRNTIRSPNFVRRLTMHTGDRTVLRILRYIAWLIILKFYLHQVLWCSGREVPSLPKLWSTYCPEQCCLAYSRYISSKQVYISSCWG